MRNCASMVVMALMLASQAQAQEYVTVNRIDIKRFQPVSSDVRAIKLLDQSTATLTDEQIAATRDAYVVRIFAKMPHASAQLPRLLIDGRDVPQYGQFSQGLFLKVYSMKQLSGWATKSVTIMIPTPQPIPSQSPVPMLFPHWHEEVVRGQSSPAALSEVLKQP